MKNKIIYSGGAEMVARRNVGNLFFHNATDPEICRPRIKLFFGRLALTALNLIVCTRWLLLGEIKKFVRGEVLMAQGRLEKFFPTVNRGPICR